jgi:hypothetical protein
MTTPLNKLKDFAAKLRATVDDTDWPNSADVIAPKGYKFSDGFCHTLAVVCSAGSLKGKVPIQWQEDAVNDAIKRMTFGLEDCPMDCECRD